MFSRVYVEITNICNKSCSFCHGTKREKRSMTMDEFALVCDRLSGVTEYIYLHVMGEPTVHPLLCDFISHASKKGFKVAVTTNGSLLPKCGDEMIDAGVYKVNVSLHSFESGESEKHAGYINGCLDFADKASRRGVLTVLRLWNGGVTDTFNSETLAILHERFPEKWHFGARGARIRDKLHLENAERFIWPDLKNEDLGDDLFCHGLGDHFGILSNGDAVPCCLDGDDEIRLGNIYTEEAKEILNSPRALAIKNGFKNKKAVEELCKKCPYARRFKI